MNVGIVTLYDFFNHGNRLQNYALEKTLKNLGHKPLSLAIASKRWLPFCYGLTRIFPFISTTRRLIRSMKFTKIDLNSKNITNIGFKKLKKYFDENLDCVIVGSDQVFNPAYILDSDKMFLRFAPKERRIAYSASFGISALPERYNNDFICGLNDMNYISIRENEGAKIVKDLTKKDVPVVVDPTMLLCKEDWEAFVEDVPEKRIPKHKYLLTYFLGPEKEYKQKVKEIAEHFGLKIININTLGDKYFDVDSKVFVSLIKNATLVCTNSFHGHALSIILEKPLVSFPSVKSKNSRIKTLLQLAGLEQRHYERLKYEDMLSLDYSDVRERVDVQRQKGLGFLKEAFSKIEKVDEDKR